MELLSGIALAIPAGLNAYIPLLALAISERAGWLSLNRPYDALGEWWAIVLIAVLLVIEVLADKIAAVDTANDVIQTVIRPAAGGIAFAAASGAVGRAHPVLMMVVGIVLAGGVHAVKATTRPVVQSATAGVGGVAVSAFEDLVAAVSSALAIVAPAVAVGFLAVSAAAVWRLLRPRRRPVGHSGADAGATTRAEHKAGRSSAADVE